jgi:hypothetical protein
MGRLLWLRKRDCGEVSHFNLRQHREHAQGYLFANRKASEKHRIGGYTGKGENLKSGRDSVALVCESLVRISSDANSLCAENLQPGYRAATVNRIGAVSSVVERLVSSLVKILSRNHNPHKSLSSRKRSAALLSRIVRNYFKNLQQWIKQWLKDGFLAELNRGSSFCET